MAIDSKINTHPLISIVIPLFNAEKYIGKTIESVIAQTYPNWELLIVDDCSTDSSQIIAEAFTKRDNRIRLVRSELNFGGPAKPRNIGVEYAKGEYIAFLDADDIWLPKKLEKQIDFMKKNHLNFTSSYCGLINEEDREVALSKKSVFFYNMISKKSLSDVIKNNFILTSSVLISRNIILQFNESKNYIAVEDFDMWLRVLSSENTIYQYQDEKLIHYRLVENSISDRTNILKQELKANIVVSNFLLHNNQYLKAYYYRLLFHLLKNHIKVFIDKLWK